MIAEKFVMLVVSDKISEDKLFVQIVIAGVPPVKTFKKSVRHIVGKVVIVAEKHAFF